MARSLFASDGATKTRRRSNPAFLGVDVVSNVKRGAGIFLAEALNQKLVTPIVRKVFRPADANNFVAKLVDAGGTVVAGVIVKDIFRAIGDQEDGRLAFQGASAFAGAKAVAAVIPGMGMNASLPNWGALVGPSAPAPAPAVAAPVAVAALPAPMMTGTGVGSMPSQVGPTKILAI